MNSFFLAYRFLLRDWRSGELQIVITALLLAVICVSSINIFINRIERGIIYQASYLLGADLAIQSNTDIPKAWQTKANQLGLTSAKTLTFLSMVSANDQLKLASIKAVSDNYPLRGVISVNDIINNKKQEITMTPSAGEVWIQPQLYSFFQIKKGDFIRIGRERFKVTKLLLSEPDQSSVWFNISPRVLMNMNDISKTGVVQKGSRLRYRWLLTGNNKALKDIKTWLRPRLLKGQKILGVNEDRPSFQLILQRANDYLNLMSFISVILAAVAIAMAMRKYSLRHESTVAIMRCFGANQQFILNVYLILFFLVGLVTILFGCAFGYIIQFFLKQLFQQWFQYALPAAGFSPYIFSMSIGFLILFVFSLPPLLHLKNISPIQVLRHEATFKMQGGVIYFIGLLCILSFLWWFSESLKLSLLLIYILIPIFILLLLCYGLILLIYSLRTHIGITWRYGLASVFRRKSSNMIQILAFGIIISVSLLLYIIRFDLITNWRNQLPKNTANYFLINIAPGDVQSLSIFFKKHQLNASHLYPLVRGRLIELNKKPIQDVVTAKAKSDNALQRVLNLSWSSILPSDNRLISGTWWNQQSEEKSVSIEQALAHRIGIQIGDEVGFQIGARKIAAKIVSIRTVDWSSFRPNFYFLFAPGVLNQFPKTYMTSFYLPPKKIALLNKLSKQFPSVSVIDVALMLNKARSILNQLTIAIEYILIFAFLGAFVVLFASVIASHDERLYESALLRALGASQRQVLFTVIMEFLVLALLAVILAIGITLFISYYLSVRILQIDFHVNSLLYFLGSMVSIISIVGLGLLSTYRVVKESPLRLLRP